MTRRGPDADDWRRQGQERYLAGRTFVLRTYAPYREGWEHDHCEFCGHKFSLADGDLQRGYVTTDNYHWVCERCFQDFCQEMAFLVE